MSFTVVHTEQGTDEWDANRRCRLTGSRIADVCAKPDSKRYKTYMQQKVLELLGHTHVEDKPEWFRHGREMEPRGLEVYEQKYGVMLDHDCFLVHDEYDWFGLSPDGLHVVEGEYTEGMEMKGRKLYKNYRDAILKAKAAHAKGDLLKAIAPEYRHQVQAAMWMTGWDHWWYVNYYEVRNTHGYPTGDYRIGRVAIPRDQKLIDEIEEKAVVFMTECYKRAEIDHA